MKLSYLGYLGFGGLLGFWEGRFFSLFFLFLLFLADIFPKRGKGLLKIILLFIITAAFISISYFNIMPLTIILYAIPLWMVGFLSVTAFYPPDRNYPTADVMNIIRDPFTKESLEFNEENMEIINHNNGALYRIMNNIPVMMDESKLNGLNKKYSAFYDKFAVFYDISQKMIYSVFYGGEKRKRMEFLTKLEIKAGDTVLETSCGTGGNLHYLPKNAAYFGLDISKGMLSVCLRNLRRWGKKAFLVQGEAENLPYNDASFDAVIHYGGINFFNDKKKAIDEMIRVAKPGARLLVADETEQVAEASKGIPGLEGIYSNKGYDKINVPTDLIPRQMQDIKCDILFDGTIYCITFKKPL